MSLEGLAKLGKITPHTPTAEEVRKLIEAARRNLEDATIDAASAATRYTCAYTAIMQAAKVAMYASGYRPFTSQGGHHATLIQSLVHTVDLAPERMRVLDALRNKRNVIDYEGEDPDEREVMDALAAATDLVTTVATWLRDEHPELA